MHGAGGPDPDLLDAPIETYLPGVVRGTGEDAGIDGHSITVRQLLQHTSGLPNYVNYLDRSDPLRHVEADRARPTRPVTPADFAPGHGWRYTNTGFILAGMLVERLTAKDIATAATDLVIRPAGLRDTYSPPTGRRDPRPARTHLRAGPGQPAGPAGERHRVRAVTGGRTRRHGVHAVGLNRLWRELFGAGCCRA